MIICCLDAVEYQNLLRSAWYVPVINTSSNNSSNHYYKALYELHVLLLYYVPMVMCCFIIKTAPDLNSKLSFIVDRETIFNVKRLYQQ